MTRRALLLLIAGLPAFLRAADPEQEVLDLITGRPRTSLSAGNVQRVLEAVRSGHAGLCDSCAPA